MTGAGPARRLATALRRGGGLGALVILCVGTGLLATGVLGAAALRSAPVVITSGSMTPSLRPGDILLAGRPAGARLDAGTVVVFRSGARLVTHRVVARRPDGAYTTRGDANRTPDPEPVRPDQIVGVARLRVPLVGVPLLWWRHGEHARLAALAAAFLVLAWLTPGGVRSPSAAAEAAS